MNSEHNSMATAHSKANIFGWVIGGVIYSYLYGNLVSLTSALLIFPGIFIASFASIITFRGNKKMEQVVAGTENPLILLGATVWLVVSKIYPYVLGALYVIMINAILMRVGA